MTVFICGRPKPPRCSSCERPTFGTCQFELRGAKAGKLCGRPICELHTFTTDGKPMCWTHHKFVAGKKGQRV